MPNHVVLTSLNLVEIYAVWLCMYEYMHVMVVLHNVKYCYSSSLPSSQNPGNRPSPRTV
jgi:hypothetical protein